MSGQSCYEPVCYADDPVPVADLLLWTGLAASKSDARRVLEQGGAYVNDERAQPGRCLQSGDLLHGRFVLLRRGKKQVSIVEVLPPGADPAGAHAPIVLMPVAA